MEYEQIEGASTNYNEHFLAIDEKICELLHQRKEISKKSIVFPPDKTLANLADEYGFQKEYLESVFTTIEMEDSFKPKVVPEEFKKYLPVLKSSEKAGVMYTVTFIRQYANASVVYLNMDWDENSDSFEVGESPDFYELFIDDSYNCHSEGGGGTTGHMSYNYIISPALPDDLTGIELIFKESGWPFNKISTGFELTITLG